MNFIMFYIVLGLALISMASSFLHGMTIHRLSMKRMVLKEGVVEKVNELREIYNYLLDSHDINDIKDKELDQLSEEEQHFREIHSILECMTALQQIEQDLALFEHERQSEDPRRREKAEIFTREFLQCRSEIEGELNKLV